MKKTLFMLFGALLCCPVLIYAQISKGGRPYSFTASFSSKVDKIDARSLPALQVKRLIEEDEKNEKQGLPLRVGIIVPVNYSLNNAGTWETLPDGGRLWRLQITASGALATSLYYQDFHLPEGATMFVYNADRTQLIGAFTSENNNREAGVFATEILRGNTCVLEYHEPAAALGQGRISISGVNHIYNTRIPESRASKVNAVKASGACNVNANCPEGANWQNQKRAVAKILFRAGGGSYLCSGALVNNAKSNCKPYFLTANHCGSDATAAEFNQWIFYFNYEAPSCANPGSDPSSNTITGCVQRARSGDNGGVDGSDFQLVEFNQNIPSSYNVYYAGWNANPAASPSGVSIHHPAGDIKKISTYSSPLTESNYGGGGVAPFTHWKAIWVQTTTNWSVTEGGSSGSPLFNNQGQIVGQLSGGPSSCGATAANKFDYYGRVSHSWISNGADNLHRLKPWLDPDNTGILSLNGTNYPCGDTTNPPVCTDQYEPNNTRATAATLPINTNIRAQIATASDSDYYKITITDVNNFSIRLDSLPANYNLQLLNASGTQLAISQNSGTTAETITYNNAAAGTYYIAVYGVSGAASNQRCYQLNATLTPVNTCAETYEPNNSRTAAATIPVNTVVSSQIASTSDKDWYKFTNTNTQRHIEITLTNLPGDYDVILYNSGGTELARSDNAGTDNESIVYNNGVVGTYYVQVYGYSGASSTSQCYKLTANISSTPKAVVISKNSKEFNKGGELKIYPVPARDRVYVELNSKVSAQQRILITDMNGRVIYDQRHRVAEGYNRIEIAVPAGARDGMYIISTDNKHHRKFIIQR